MGYARDANTFISIVRLLPKVRNMLSSTRIPICLKTEIFAVFAKIRVHNCNTRMLKRRRYESINDRTCTVWYMALSLVKKPQFSFVQTKRISQAFSKISCTLGPVFQNLRSGHRKRRLREEEGEGYVHIIRGSFSRRQVKLSGAVWTATTRGCTVWLHKRRSGVVSREGLVHS